MVELVRGRSGSADLCKDVQEAMREKRNPPLFEKTLHVMCANLDRVPEGMRQWKGFGLDNDLAHCLLSILCDKSVKDILVQAARI